MTQKSLRLCAVTALIMSSLLLAACDEGDESNSPSNTAVTSSQPAPGTANASNKSSQPAPSTANPANKATSTYYGAIDYRDCDSVKGWVWNGADPNANIRVELYVDGKPVDTQPARDPRPDLKSSNIGTGNYGFSFKIPATYKDGKQHTVSAKVAGGDYTLPINQGVFPAVTCKP